MELKKGYKQTEVGVIPSDWEVKKLGEYLLKKPDYGINAPAVPLFDALPTYIRITDISDDGLFIKNDNVSVNHPQAELYFLEKGDLVFARTGASVGKTYLYNQEDGKLVFAGFLIRVRPRQKILDSNYLKFFTQTSLYWNWVGVNSMRSGQPGINGHEYSQLPIPLPPTIAEQTAIAAALSDADALIQSLEKLIAKKRLIKQGAMQKLLKPKEGWVVKKLGEIAFFTNGKAHEQFIDDAGDYIVVNSKFISTEGEVFKNASISLCPLNIGGITMVMSDIPNGKALAKCFIIPKSGKYTLNQRICALRTETLDTIFLTFVINRNKYFLAFDSGTGQTNLKKQDVLECPINLPPTKKEQIAIAKVLSDMDAEISVLETKLSKYKHIKQGMMQNLLTGKIRLV